MSTAIIAVCGSTAMSAIFSQDFDSLTTGATSVSGLTFSNTGTDRVIRVQDASANKVGTKSLLLADTEFGNNNPLQITSSAFASTPEFQLSLDAWISVKPGTDFQILLRGPAEVGGAEIEVARLYFTSATASTFNARFGDGLSGSGNTTVNLLGGTNTYAVDTQYAISINADTDLDKYSVTVGSNTTPMLNFGGNAKVSGITSFRFAVGFGTASADRYMTGYLDNITATAVPEPASLGLIGLAAMALRRRRR